MTQHLTGGCKCGLVRYSGTLAAFPMIRCHCRDCQQLTGTGHADMMPLDEATFQITDACKVFEMTGDTGGRSLSGFCPDCGSQLTRRFDTLSGEVFVHAASLDDPTAYTPSRSIFTGSAQPWDHDIIAAKA